MFPVIADMQILLTRLFNPDLEKWNEKGMEKAGIGHTGAREAGRKRIDELQGDFERYDRTQYMATQVCQRG